MEKLEEQYKKEKFKLFKYIRSRVNTDEDAEDVLQDVFYKAANNFDAIEPLNSITSWLYTVAKNRIVDVFRKKKELIESDLYLGEDDLTLEEIIEDSGISVDDELTEKMVNEQIEKAIGNLPEKQRKVFIAHELDGLSFKEISEITGDSVNTLLSRKRYAVRALRNQLEDLYNLIAEV